MKNAIKENIEGLLALVIGLIVLDKILEITGTTFFGVNHAPLIALIIVLLLLLGDLETLSKIKNIFKKIFH